jgi:hypothetical protein
MELAIKSKEIFPSAEIRSLSDAEIDQVDGGSAGLAVGAVLIAAVVITLWQVHNYQKSKS